MFHDMEYFETDSQTDTEIESFHGVECIDFIASSNRAAP